MAPLVGLVPPHTVRARAGRVPGAGQPSTPPQKPANSAHSHGWKIAKIVAASAVAALLIGYALPRAVGVEWTEIVVIFARLTVLQIAGIAVLWLAGLWVNTLALTAAMPGLSSRRAFFLNLTGSFVSNLLPLGGAAGTVANYTMSRAWGFTPGAFARWAILTNLWDTLVKLALPAVALCWLALSGLQSDRQLMGVAAAGVLLLGVLAAGAVFLARGETGARSVGRAADWIARRVGRRPLAPGGYAERAAEFRRDSSELIAAGWARMTVGKVAYVLLQACLLWLCLHVLGSSVSAVVVFAAFAVERILTMAAITPGATGVVEVGMAGVLVALHGDAATTAAGVLLYRGFIFAMEIPVGGLGMLWWGLRRRQPVPVAARITPT